jgi:uncharacterized protein (DUF4213/DUF364 family)
VERILEEVARRDAVRDADLIDVRVGPYWTAVKTSLGTGLASTMSHETERDQAHPIADAGELHERTPLELSACLRSRSAPEAAVGLAAVNALLPRPTGNLAEVNAADLLCDRAAGRLLALVGHFPFVDRLRAACREVWVFERGGRQQPGDLGERHMEELIHHAEVVAITATTLLNGTLDRIVGLLGPESFVVMLGPSTPYATSLFELGFDALCGTVVEDDEAVVRAVSQGAVTGQIPGVGRVCLFREGKA